MNNHRQHLSKVTTDHDNFSAERNQGSIHNMSNDPAHRLKDMSMHHGCLVPDDEVGRINNGSDLLLVGNNAGGVFENWNGDLEDRVCSTSTVKDQSCYIGRREDNNITFHNTTDLFNQCVVEKRFAGTTWPVNKIEVGPSEAEGYGDGGDDFVKYYPLLDIQGLNVRTRQLGELFTRFSLWSELDFGM